MSMSAETTRDRRAPLFGGASSSQNHSALDIESLEKDNDRGIAALGERVGLLKNITSGIHTEAEAHHSLLDRVAQGVGGARLGLGATVGKFKKVMEEPHGRRTVYGAVGVAFFLFVLYMWLR